MDVMIFFITKSNGNIMLNETNSKTKFNLYFQSRRNVTRLPLASMENEGNRPAYFKRNWGEGENLKAFRLISNRKKLLIN